MSNTNHESEVLMDPNTALVNLLAAIAEIQRLEDLDISPGEVPAHDLSVANAARDAAEAGDALNGWLSKGGFLPDAWRQPVVPAFGVNPLVDEMLHVVFVVALEGGIGYWAASSSYHWSNVVDGERVPDLEGFHSDVEDAEGDDAFPAGRIDRATIARGFERIAAGPVEFFPEDQRGKFLVMLQARLAGLDDERVDIDFDAGEADNLVQTGLLGKVIFG